MARGPSRAQLTKTVLGVSVLTDLDLTAGVRGVNLPGTPELFVPWKQVREALNGFRHNTARGRVEVALWLRHRRWLANHVIDDLIERARPVGLPISHPLHPGPAWVRAYVAGGDLELGLGFVGIEPGHPDRVVVVAPSALIHAGLTLLANSCWPDAMRYLESMGRRAAERLFRHNDGVLKPMGDCDVLTLLASRAYREALCDGHPDGLCPAAVPLRDRGWLDLRRIDPAYAPTASRAARKDERGFPRPLLVTVDEVRMVAAGGSIEIAMNDPAPTHAWLRPLRYR